MSANSRDSQSREAVSPVAAKSAGSSKILKNFSTMTSVKVASDVFTFVLFVVLSRTFGQDGIGQYSFGMAVTGFFAVFADFGLYNLNIKEASRKNGSLQDDFGAALILRVGYTLLGLAGLLVAVQFLPISEQGRRIVLLLGIYQFGYRLTYGFSSLFVAKERMGVVAGLEFVLRVVTSIGGVCIALMGGSLVLAVGVLPAVTAIEVVVAFALAVRHFGAPNLRVGWRVTIATAKRAAPYGLSGILFQLQSRVDVFFLGILLSEAAVGVYNAAFRVVFMLSFLTYYAGVAIFPAASRLYEESLVDLRQLYATSLRIFVLLGVPAAVGISLVAPELIPLIFGSGFEETIVVLRLLTALVVISGLKNLLSFFLMACDGQVQRVKNQWIAASVNVALNASLIPVLGIVGAALSVILAEMLLATLLIHELSRRIGWPPIASRLWASALASACFAVPVWWVGSVPMLVIIPCALPIYIAALFAFKDIRRSEIQLALTWLRMRAPGVGAALQP